MALACRCEHLKRNWLPEAAIFRGPLDVGDPPHRGPKSWPWYWSLNPTLDRSFHGESVNQGVVFSPNFKFSYDFTKKITGGLEYYGSVGPVTGFLALNQQQHQIFPAVDLN